MSEALSRRPKLRAVNNLNHYERKPERAATLRLCCDWKRVLQDITSCGLVHQEVSNGVATLKSAGEPWYADVEGISAWLRGPGAAIAGLTDHWAMASLARSDRDGKFQHLDISDYVGNRLLRLSLTEDSNWDGFNTLLVRQWARRSAPLVLPGREDLAPSLAKLEEAAGLRLVGPLAENWYDSNRNHYPGIPIDATLLSPFLETLADQLCPLNLLIGNRGLVQQHESAFYECIQRAGMLRMRSSTAELEIDLHKVVGARLVGRGSSERAGAIRLHDEKCRCVAVVALSAGAQSNDRQLWQMMLRALSSD